jgi:ABC-type tungstate transport system substrate-binding protein
VNGLDRFQPLAWSVLGLILAVWSLFDNGPEGDFRTLVALGCLIMGQVVRIRLEIDGWRKL